MDDETLVRVARALGDGTRFRVLRAVAEAAEVSVGDLAVQVGVSQPTVSHHLKTLAECDLVAVRHAGQHSFFSVRGDTVAAACEGLRTTFWSGARLPDLGWGVID